LLIPLIIFSAKLGAQTNASNELSLYLDQPEVLKKAGVKSVRCIFKDSRRLIWIGTDNGLFRYDGTNTIYQRHKPADTTSIPNNTIVSISEDKKGNIWLGTMGGIARMNPFNFKCTVYRDELHNLPKGNFDNKILVDPTGKIWAGNGEGLFLFNEKNNRFDKVWKSFLKGKIVSAYVTCVAYWLPDTLVLGTFNDIVLFNTKNYGFRRITLLNKDILATHVLVDDLHRLWIGTWGEGCLVGNPTLTQFQQYKWEKDLRSGVDNIANAIIKTTSLGGQDIWISGGWMLSKIPVENNPGLKEIFTYKLRQNSKTNEPINIATLMADEDYIWTGGSIVSKFSAGKNLFQILPVPFSGAVQDIQHVEINNKDYIAVSMWHGKQGFLLINKQDNSYQFINSLAPADVFGTNISGLAIDKNKRIWISFLAGVYVLNDHLKIIKDLSKIKEIPSARKTNGILISNDTVWIACYKNGIDLYNLNFHKLKHFIDHDGSGLLDNLIEKIFRDKHGNIWICGNGSFYKYLPATASFKRYDLSIEHTVYSPTDVAEMPNGNLMIASETGLISFDPTIEKYHRISTPLLEKEEIIVSVAVDHNGDVWYLTSGHLVHYQPASGKFTLFGEEDGLNTNALQCVRTFDGKKIYLTESNRLLQFTPENWQKEVASPQVVIHSIQVKDSFLKFASPLHQLHLNYDQNKIYFEFDGITYTKPEQNQYAYKLTWVEKCWIIGNRNFVSYANLSPGNYEFHVKAANYAGVWSKEYVIKVFIKPPYWQTWWFIGLAVLAFSGLFVFVIRYISQRNLRERILRLEKEQAIEKERNRIARDMHDDLGSGLTKIAILSEVAKTQLQEKTAATVQLENISHSSRELVDNLQNIIWVLNPQNDSLENLAAYIREYTLKFFDSTDVVVHFNYPQQIPSIKLSEEQRRNIFMVVKETLNNIAKHSCCNLTSIDLSLKNRQLQISIKDNGKGFEMSSIRQFANGLSNMKQRMEQINGLYEIQSACNAGTTTKLSVTL
jgi:signal transduction histidine kinase/ligand-binding sensor domain-containing protein